MITIHFVIYIIIIIIIIIDLVKIKLLKDFFNKKNLYQGIVINK